MTRAEGTSYAEQATSIPEHGGRRRRITASWRATAGRITRPVHHRSVDALRSALLEKDPVALGVLLRADVAVVVDPGPAPSPPMRVLTGRRVAATALLHGVSGDRDMFIEVRSVNGQAGLVIRAHQETVAVICVDFTGGLASALWVRLRPDQLRHGNHI